MNETARAVATGRPSQDPSGAATEILYGRNPVVEAARGGRKLYKIWLLDTAAKALRKALSDHWNIVKIVSKADMSDITGRGDHQGAAAEAETYRYANLKAISELPSGIVLACDSITDPRNLGAIIRSGVLLGTQGIIIPIKHSAQITPVVCHTSAGATEHIAIARVDSLAHSLGIMKSRGFLIAGTEAPSALLLKGSWRQAQSNQEAISILDFTGQKKIVLVLGSEGAGLGKKVHSLCDVFLYIPQRADFDSFNVSVAASIIVWELNRR